MQWSTWWQIFIALNARSYVAAALPSLCDEDYCSCDAFTRVNCSCPPGTELILPGGSHRLSMTTSSIRLTGCARVQFLPDALRSINELQKVKLFNIGQIIISERSLVWPTHGSPRGTFEGSSILIHNSTVQEIGSNAIQGQVDEIIITDSRIKNIRPFAFSGFNTASNIRFSHVTFDNIEAQAFKKFSVLNFVIEESSIKTIPSRCFSDIDIAYDFTLRRMLINHIFSLSFLISSPKTITLEQNIIGILEGDAFQGTIGGIYLRNNTIVNLKNGVFMGLRMGNSRTYSASEREIHIKNTTVSYATPQSLLYNRSIWKLRIDGLHLNTPCSCELSEEWDELSNKEGGTITCHYELENRHSTLSSYQEARCGSFKSNFWIYVVGGLILMAFVVITVIFIIIKREREKKNRVSLVMPDGKTYRETEFHIVVERAELLTTDL